MNNFIEALKEEAGTISLLTKRLKEFKKPRLSLDDWYKFKDAEKIVTSVRRSSQMTTSR